MATIRTKDLTNASAPSDTSESLWDNLASTVRVNYLELKADIAASFVAAPATYDLATLHTDGLLKADQVRYSGLVFLGTSTVALLPNPNTLTAGQFYIITTGGTLWSNTWTTGEAAISNGTVYSVGPNPTQQIAEGGTGATTAAAARTNLDVMLTADVNDRQLSKAPSNGLYFAANQVDKVAISTSALCSLGDGTSDKAFSGSAVVTANDYTSLFICGRQSSSSLEEWTLEFNSSDKLAVTLFDESATAQLSMVQDTASAVDGETVHVAFTYDGRGGATASAGIALYINGVVVPSTAGTPSGTYVASEALTQDTTFGLSPKSGADMDGIIHSGLFFNRELTAAEILRLSISNVPEVADQWGKADGGTYTSDFTSNSIDGFAFDSSNSPTSDATATVGADTDNVKFIAGSGTGTARTWKSVGATAEKRYRVSFDYYIPSGQTYVDGFKTGLNVNLTSGNYTDSATLATNAWTPFTTDLSSPLDPGNTSFFILLKDGASTTINALAVGEYIAFRNIKVTEIGAVISLNPDNIEADGDWIDSSSNELNGTATGATPLMVKPQTSGTFTPVLEFATPVTTRPSGSFLGEWVKVSEKVIQFTLRITLTSKGDDTGSAEIHGMPEFFKNLAMNTAAVFTCSGSSMANLTSVPQAKGRVNTDELVLEDYGAAGGVDLDNTNFLDTTTITVHGTYEIV